MATVVVVARSPAVTASGKKAGLQGKKPTQACCLTHLALQALITDSETEAQRGHLGWLKATELSNSFDKEKRAMNLQ